MIESKTESNPNKYSVITTWGMGADDVLLTVTQYDDSKIYVDMSAAQAIDVGQKLIIAGKQAQRIDAEYDDTMLGIWFLGMLFSSLEENKLVTV